MAEVQLKRKITLRRKEKPAEFTIIVFTTGYYSIVCK